MEADGTTRAVVLGAGMAGLLTARVLADTYDEVTVVDRDRLPGGVAPRAGAPQGRHAHALLARGQQVLEDLLPGITAQIAAAGGLLGDVLADTRLYLSDARLLQVASGLVLVHASRPLLEGHVRARVGALPGVTLVDRCDVVGLATAADGGRVTGARVLRRADGSAGEVLPADLVVDATGRGARTDRWLGALGYAAPPVDTVTVDLGYATRRYRLGRSALDGDLGVLHGLTPAHPRGGALALLEGDQAMLTLIGIVGDHPPTDPAGFTAFAASLRHPDIHDAVRDAEPLDDPVGFRFAANVRRRYERVARWPAGLLVVGDALCSFNPAYGQGMTMAALQACVLRDHLRHRVVPHARPYFTDVACLLDGPWSMATGADLAFPGVAGPRTRALRLLGAYVPRLHAAAAHDARLARRVVEVSAMVATPATLVRPDVVARVVRARIGRRGGQRRQPVPGAVG